MHAGDVLIERYELLSRIAEGGMGVVFRAWDRVGQRYVALKLLKDFGDRNVDRFEREAGLLGELQHPNIVRFVDYGRSPSCEIFLAMEWLTGETLADLLTRRRLTPAEVIEIGLRLSSALSLAHSRGVVHRDLKPGNMVAILFLQTRLDKVLNWKDNTDWLTGHFAKSILKGTAALLLPVITLVELAAGACSAIGCVQVLLHGSPLIGGFGMLFGTKAIVLLFFGQRVAKDYAGAASLVPYFLLCAGGMWVFMS